MKISIIIPAYNEEKRIGKTLEAYSRYFNELENNKKISYEILVVINGTTDNTEKVVKEYCKANKKIKYLNFERGGKGFAITEGFKESLKKDFELIGFVDADMATPPEEYWRLVENIGKYDGIIASRYTHNAKVFPKQSVTRIFASRSFNFLVRVLFLMPYKDTQCGAKIFRKKCIEQVLPQMGMTQWAYDIDLLYRLRKNKVRIREFPSVWRDIEGSKLNIKKSSIQMFLAIIQLRILHSPIKGSWKFFKPLAGMLWRIAK